MADVPPLGDLSFPFLMDLYRVKMMAEKREDAKAVEHLKQRYPELFFPEFEDFIEMVKAAASYVDQEHETNFSSALFIQEDEKVSSSRH